MSGFRVSVVLYTMRHFPHLPTGHSPDSSGECPHMVEAAGQLFHLFRDGLDYAFIPHRCTVSRMRGVLFEHRSARILVPALSLSSQPVYESLQGRTSWP